MKRLLTAAGLLLTAYLVVVLLGGISNLAAFAERMHPVAGVIVFWSLSAIFAVLLSWPAYLYFRLPSAPLPPEAPNGPEHDAYMASLRARLRSNPKLAGRTMETNADTLMCLDALKAEAEKVIEQTASTVFAGTAVMQNGRLDGFVVLATQARMVWQIAAIYNQRPTPRQMLHLYTNVGVTAFIATSIDDVDFEAIVTPIVAAVIPSLKGGIPGLQGVTSILVNSLANGSANAFLTLRVGAVAQQYCGATSLLPRHAVRRTATRAAAAHVGRIAKVNGYRIAQTAATAIKEGVSGSASGAVEGVRSVGTSMTGLMRRKRPEPTSE